MIHSSSSKFLSGASTSRLSTAQSTRQAALSRTVSSKSGRFSTDDNTEASGEPEEDEPDEETQIDEEIQKRFDLIHTNIFSKIHFESALKVSNQYRHNLEHNGPTFCYSEVNPQSFLKLLVCLVDFDVEFRENANFVDIGCGVGKTLVVAALLNQFKRIIGIELVPSLFRKTQDTVKRFITNYRTPMDQSDIELWQGDGTFMDWSFVTLAYVQATNFDRSMMERISAIADRMEVGSVIMVVNNRLTNETHFDIVGITEVEYVYDKMTVFLYKRNSVAEIKSVEKVKARLTSILDRQYVI